MLPHRRSRRRLDPPVLALVVIALVATAGHGFRAVAAPVPAFTQQAAAVRVLQSTPSVTTTGTLDATVMVTLSAPAEYVEVRFRLYSPSGALLYQKTELRPNSPEGPLTVRFVRQLGDFTVREGRHPIDVRVLATGADPTEAESRLLIVDAGRAPVAVAVIARLTGTPATDSEGLFVVDPESQLHPRADAARIAEIAERRAGRDLSIAIAPLLLEEWVLVAAGYETTGSAGVRQVPAASETSLAAADTLQQLRALATSVKVEFIDIPYSAPDVASMSAHGLIGDLTEHWALGDALFAATLDARPSSSWAVPGDLVPADALPVLAERGIRTIAAAAACVAAGDTTATSGVYDIGSGIRAVVLEPRLIEAIAASDREAFYDVIFERLDSKDDDRPLALLLDIGSGSGLTARAVEDALGWLDAAAWARATTLGDAADAGPRSAAALIDEPPLPAWPAGYWADVTKAHEYMRAAAAALGPEDPDSRSARRGVLIAESLAWTADAGSPGTAERGRAFAKGVTERIAAVFSAVTVNGRDVTLANRRGAVPVSVNNGSDRPLVVRVVVRASRIGAVSPQGEITLDPGENVVSIPVDTAFEISDRLDVSILAADVTLGQTQFTVRTSYLDQLVSVGTVVLFLIGMLIFIRRRVRTAIAGNIAEDNGPPDDAATGAPMTYEEPL